METNFSLDRPAHNVDDDKFQRYGFAKRVAQTIVDRKSDECLIIGIYGAWGEGKTSVLNFIESELSHDNQTIVVKFNPWRYSDEQSLLLQFFGKLALALKSNLKTKKEKIGEHLKKYSKLLTIEVPIVGNVGDVIEGAANFLSNVDVDELKRRIDKIIQESKHKVVIIVDDIDRLDKEEIHSVFRLVKLNADFLKTTYILSFDDEMVSAAIAERFGETNKKAGQNFLEKIIQVPLRLPLAQPEALKQFCFELVEEAINSVKTNLSEAEAQRFGKVFSNTIIPRLSTPRLAVRYGNTLSFSLPLLSGEVNIVDLMLIEAVKVFYPGHYEFVKANPEYFVGQYLDTFSSTPVEDKKKAIREEFESVGKYLNPKQQKGVKYLLSGLFPRLAQALSNNHYDIKKEDDLYQRQSISSPEYFDRYFSYSVIKGQLSDVAFQDFLKSISQNTIVEVVKSIEMLINKSSAEKFMRKLRRIEIELDWASSEKVALSIAKVSKLFPEPTQGNWMFRYTYPKWQALYFIEEVLKNHANVQERFSLAKKLLIQAEPFEFAFDLFNQLGVQSKGKERLFDDEKYAVLTYTMVERTLAVTEGVPVFEYFADGYQTVIEASAKNDSDRWTEYYKSILDNDCKKVVNLLRSFSPTMYSTALKGTYKGDYNESLYNYFVSIFDKNFINTLILKQYSEMELNAEEVQWSDGWKNIQSDINMARQFLHWYQSESVKGIPN